MRGFDGAFASASSQSVTGSCHSRLRSIVATPSVTTTITAATATERGARRARPSPASATSTANPASGRYMRCSNTRSAIGTIDELGASARSARPSQNAAASRRARRRPTSMASTTIQPSAGTTTGGVSQRVASGQSYSIVWLAGQTSRRK